MKAATMRAKHAFLGSIRARTVAAFSLFFTILIAIAGTCLAGYIRKDVEGDADRLIGEIALRIRAEISVEHEPATDRLIEDEERVSGEKLWMAVVDAHGKRQYASPGAPPPDKDPAPDLWRTSRATWPEGTVYIGMDWRREAARLQVLTTGIVLFSAVMFAAASAGAWVLVGRTLKPIQDLSEQAQSAAVATEHVRLVSPSDDTEMVGLVATLNELLGRIEDVSSARGRFYAAASHELRTPLQALSGHLELAGSRNRTEEEYQALLQEAQSQTRRLVHLTRDLLVLNQLEAAAPGAYETDHISLADSVERAVQSLQDRAASNGVTIGLSIQNADEVEIVAPPTHVDMVVRNLIENAVKFADQGTTIQVTLQTLLAPELTVFNTCTPPAEWNSERVFEAFYRPDPSRSLATGGNGLGLAICKAVCDRCKWQIRVVPSQGGVLAILSFFSELRAVD